MKRKEPIRKNLQTVPVYFEDKTETSPEYFRITKFPNQLTSGKNLVKLSGHPTNLAINSIVNLQILDYNGDPIYHEILNYLDQDKSRAIAIYVYEDTPPGLATMTIIAEAAVINGEPVPPEWQGKSNIKWTKQLPINPLTPNISEIIYERVPELAVGELISTQFDRVYVNTPTFASNHSEYYKQFPTYTGSLNAGRVQYIKQSGDPVIILSNASFTSDMVNGTLTVSNPATPLPNPNYPVSTTPYVTTIKKILSTTTALVDTVYTAYSSQSILLHTYTSFANSTFSLQYETTPTYVVTQNSQSFANIQINGLDPDTGDVSDFKLYINNSGTIGDWELINDIALTETNIFTDQLNLIEPSKSITRFKSQNIINTYWTSSIYQNGSLFAVPALFTSSLLTYSTSSLIDAMKISSSISLADRTSVQVVRIKPEYVGIFHEETSYKIVFDAIGTITGSQPPVLSIYVSGSAFYENPTDFFNQTFTPKFGKKIGELTVTGANQRFDDKVFSFESDYTGTGTLMFVVESGEWQVSDVRVTTDNDAGYSPNYTNLYTIIPTKHKSQNQISFKIEYYNVNGEKSKQSSYLYGENWEGGNHYIDGDYSLITGSTYASSHYGKGIELGGGKSGSAGFLQSVGFSPLNPTYDAGKREYNDPQIKPGWILSSGSIAGVPGAGPKGQFLSDNGNYITLGADGVTGASSNMWLGNRLTAYIAIGETGYGQYSAGPPHTNLSGSQGTNPGPGQLAISSSCFHVPRAGGQVHICNLFSPRISGSLHGTASWAINVVNGGGGSNTGSDYTIAVHSCTLPIARQTSWYDYNTTWIGGANHYDKSSTNYPENGVLQGANLQHTYEGWSSGKWNIGVKTSYLDPNGAAKQFRFFAHQLTSLIPISQDTTHIYLNGLWNQSGTTAGQFQYLHVRLFHFTCADFAGLVPGHPGGSGYVAKAAYWDTHYNSAPVNSAGAAATCFDYLIDMTGKNSGQGLKIGDFIAIGFYLDDTNFPSYDTSKGDSYNNISYSLKSTTYQLDRYKK